MKKEATSKINQSEHKVITQLNISSTAFTNEGFIPEKYTCDGQNVNPPLTISKLPENTKSLVLIVEDPDAPSGTWIHWLVWNISPIRTIPENSIPGIEGVNDFHKHNYGGPCPPSGKHRYFFKLYALDSSLTFATDSKKHKLETAMESHVIGYGELIGLYQKKLK